MKVTVVAVGRLKAGPERELLDRYRDRADRAGRQLGLTFDIREIPESRQPAAGRPGGRRSCAGRRRVLVALDEPASPRQPRFADRSPWRDAATDLVVAIGGADGSAGVLDRPTPPRLRRHDLAHQLVRSPRRAALPGRHDPPATPITATDRAASAELVDRSLVLAPSVGGCAGIADATRLALPRAMLARSQRACRDRVASASEVTGITLERSR